MRGPSLNRQHVTHGRAEWTREGAHDAPALDRIIELGIVRLDILGQLAFLEQPRGRVFERCLHVVSVEPKTPRDRVRKALRVLTERLIGGGLRCNEGLVLPNRLAVAPPIKAEGPPWQLFARIPFALAVMQEPFWRKAPPEPADEFVGTAALGRTERGRVPFCRLVIVARNEGRLATNRQPHVTVRKVAVDLFTKRVEGAPCRVRERVGHARRFRNARDARVEREGDLRRLDRAADGGGGAKMRRGGERQMTFGAEETRSRIEADPAGAGHIDLGPSMQICEVLCRARRALERWCVWPQLDEIAGHESRCEPQVPQDLYLQPRAIATRARA